jgi:hypothetical protein
VKDGRAADDIYPTYYGAKDAHTLRPLGESVNLPSEFRALSDSAPTLQPLLRASGVLRTPSHACPIMARVLDGFGATMMMVFRKESAESARTAYAV